MLLHLTDLSSEPIHKQISRQLAEKILAGDLTAGEKLPSARTLARTQHVNVHTVERAYRNLESDELIAIIEKNSAIVNALTAEKKHAIALRMLAGEGSPLNIVKAVSDELISVFEPTKLAGIFANNLKRHLLVNHVYFTTHQKNSNQFAILPAEKNQNIYLVDRKDVMLGAIQKTTIPISIDELETEARGDLLDELMTRNIRMIVPLHSETGFLGFIALTGKITGTAFSYHEIMLLSVLARQFVAALNTSRLYVEMLEKRRMEEELSVARQIQQDLLPKELPGN
ncbi:MAG: GntR family transcriptional regulator, partial [bacterium]